VILHADDLSHLKSRLTRIRSPGGDGCQSQEGSDPIQQPSPEPPFLDLATRELKVIDRGKADRIAGLPGRRMGMGGVQRVDLLQVTVPAVEGQQRGDHWAIEPVLRMFPRLDPAASIFISSYRYFDPVYDNPHFDLNFPGVSPT
jgi:hypothetical protein